jgi:flagellar biosynthesis/type III secretory pathway ATPase
VLDDAVRVLPALERLLRQNPGEHSTRTQALAMLAAAIGPAEAHA